MFKIFIFAVIALLFINYSQVMNNETQFFTDTFTPIQEKSFDSKITIGDRPFNIDNGSLVMEKQVSKIDQYKEKVISAKNKLVSKIKTYKKVYDTTK